MELFAIQTDNPKITVRVNFLRLGIAERQKRIVLRAKLGIAQGVQRHW